MSPNKHLLKKLHIIALSLVKWGFAFILYRTGMQYCPVLNCIQIFAALSCIAFIFVVCNKLKRTAILWSSLTDAMTFAFVAFAFDVRVVIEILIGEKSKTIFDFLLMVVLLTIPPFRCLYCDSGFNNVSCTLLGHSSYEWNV